eukprot:1565471-Rhodomonas_salina.1
MRCVVSETEERVWVSGTGAGGGRAAAARRGRGRGAQRRRGHRQLLRHRRPRPRRRPPVGTRFPAHGGLRPARARGALAVAVGGAVAGGGVAWRPRPPRASPSDTRLPPRA